MSRSFGSRLGRRSASPPRVKLFSEFKANVSRTAKIILALGVIAVVVYIVASTLRLGKVSCDVCLTFKGQNACRSAAGATRDEAVNAAKGTACADLASGRDESIACENTPLTSVACKP